MSDPKQDDTDLSRTLITLEMSLQQVLAVLDASNEDQAELKAEVRSVHDMLYVGVQGQEPLIQRVVLLERDRKWVASAIKSLRDDGKDGKEGKGITAKKLALWSSVITALGLIIAEYVRSGK